MLNYNYLLPDDFPVNVLIQEQVFCCSITKTYIGTLDECFIGEYPLLPLQSALQNIVVNSTSTGLQAWSVLIADSNALGI